MAVESSAAPPDSRNLLCMLSSQSNLPRRRPADTDQAVSFTLRRLTFSHKTRLGADLAELKGVSPLCALLGWNIAISSHNYDQDKSRYGAAGPSDARLLPPGNRSQTGWRGESLAGQRSRDRWGRRCDAGESQMPPKHTYLISRNSSIPYFEPSRPIPDSLTPPKGATSVEMMPVLTPTIPLSSASATRHTRPRSRA